MKSEKNPGSLRDRIIKNSFWGISASLINRVGALFFTIILARFLMPEGYGLYSIVLSTAMIFCTFADLGTSRAFIRYLSLAIKNSPKKVSSYHYYLLKIKLLLTLALSILLLILAYPLSKYAFRNTELFLPLLVSSFYIFVLSLEGFYSGVFYAIEKVKYLSIKESIVQLSRIILALFVFYFIASFYHIVGIFVVLTMSLLITWIVLFYILKKLIPALFIKSGAIIEKKNLRRFVGYVTITSISGIFFSYVDSIMLAIFVSAEYVGYYRAASSFVFGIAGMLSFLSLILLSSFSKMNWKENNKLLEVSFKYIIMLSVPSILGFIVFGKYFIRLLYGTAYIPAFLPLYFLSPLLFFVVSIGLFSSLFEAKGNPKILAKLMIISTFMNIILNIVFIKLFLSISPLWATAGASISTLISWIFYFTASIHHIRKKITFPVHFNQALKPLFSSLIMAIVLFFFLSYFVKEVSFLSGIFMVLLGALLYFLILLLIKGIGKEDIVLMKKIFGIKAKTD